MNSMSLFFVLLTVSSLLTTNATAYKSKSTTRMRFHVPEINAGYAKYQTSHPISRLNSLLLLVRGGGDRLHPTKDTKKEVADVGTAGIPASVFNLVNNVAGAGLLTLAAAKATANVGWIPAISITVCLAALSAHTFTLIGKACEITGEKNFAGLWSSAFGPKSSHLVSLIVFLQGSASQIIYSGMLGDIFTALFQMVGVPASINNRTSNIILFTTLLLLPMCLLKNLAALAFTSILGFSAVMYTVLFISYRAFDGTYSIGNPGTTTSSVGNFIVDNVISSKPSFAKSSWWNIDFKSLVLVSNLGLAYIAHYNAPTYFRELKHATSERFGKTVGISYGILALIYVATMCAGYATFGDACRNNILLNYHPMDILSTLGRLATGLSILFGFPLVNNGAREGLKNFCSSVGWKAVVDPKNHRTLTVAYLAVLTLISVSVRDVGLVVGLAGAIFGSFLVYICPALIYTTIVKKTKGEGSVEYSKARKNLALIPFGLFCGAMGASMTIREAIKRS